MTDKVVVTGGAGFIGSHLTKQLAAYGYRVTVFDNLQLSYGQLTNLKDIQADIEYTYGDVCNFDDVLRTVKDAKFVFHLAAISHLPICQANPLKCFRANYGGTLNVLEAARVSNVETVIFAGTDHIYGHQASIPISEDCPYHPEDAYALSKTEGVRLCLLYHRAYGLDVRILVSGNVFGEHQDSSKVVPIFIQQALRNEPLSVDGGMQTRDFYYVGNLVNAYILVATSSGLASGEVFNVGGGDEISILNLAERIIEACHSRSALESRKYRYSDNSNSRLLLDRSKIERVLGYREEIGFATGLERTVEFHRNNGIQCELATVKEKGAKR